MNLNPSALIMYAIIYLLQPIIEKESALKDISFYKWNKHRTGFSDFVGYCVILFLFQVFFIIKGY